MRSLLLIHKASFTLAFSSALETSQCSAALMGALPLIVGEKNNHLWKL
jgi:hypothetical protein